MKKGFTLLEMVVVLLIGALIFLLTVPNIQKTIQTAQEKGCQNQLKIVDAAIVQYMIIHDHTPNDISELVDESLLSDKQIICQNGQSIAIVDGEATLE